MATSDKADKAVKAKSTGKTGGTDMKQPAAGPVVPSAPVRAGDAVTVSLEGAIAALNELTGERVSDAVVDQVFEKFCVGK